MIHNINELQIRFRGLLDTLCREYGMAAAFEYGMPEDIYNEWDAFDNAAEHLGVWCGTGCTKFVIGDEYHDYVIKIQPPYLDDDHSEFDYCGREVEVYNAAVVGGFADKFAWTAKLFDYDFGDGIVLPVYVMECCQCGYEMIDDEMDDWHYTKYCTSHRLEKSDDAFNEYCSNGRHSGSDSERMLEWAFSVWGGEYSPSSDFVCFMRDMCVNDIHAGNWGWCNNRLVLVDYSGYGVDMDDRSLRY